MRTYRRAYLPKDLVAGIVLTAILVPAGMGYAEASGLPPIIGLYASIVPLLAYARPRPVADPGPRPGLVTGPAHRGRDHPAVGWRPDRAVTLAALLAVIVGVVVVTAGIARLGFLTDLLSAPVRVGYLNGIALIVIVGQLPKLFGFSVDADGLVDEARAFVDRRGRRGDATRSRWPSASPAWPSSSASSGGARRCPGILVAVIGSTVLSAVLDLAARTGLPVIGPLPVGLPPLTIPSIEPGDILALVPAALGIALVSATDTSVLSRTLSIRRGEEVNQDRELIGLGAANLATGLLLGDADQQQLVAHAGRRGGGGADAADLGHRGRRHRRHAGGPARPAGRPPVDHAGRRGHLGRPVAHRRPVGRAAVADRLGRVLAVDDDLRRGRVRGRHRGRLPRGRAVACRVHPACLVAARRRPRPRRRASRATTT